MWTYKTYDELYHHGIKGQKWGVQNGPPYPLDYDDHTSREKRANWQQSLDKKENDDLKLDIIRKNSRDLEKITIKELLNDPRVKKGMKAAAITLSVIAAYKVSKAIIHSPYVQEKIAPGAMRIFKERWADEMMSHSEYKDLASIPKSSIDYLDSFMSDTNRLNDYKLLTKSNNPGWPDNPGRTNNCFLCTTNMVMKLKGYDTTAAECSKGWPSEMCSELFNGAKVVRPKMFSYKKLMNELVQQGEGAYGDMSVSWKSGGSHSILYIIKNGEAQFIDGQANLKYDPKRLFAKANVFSTEYTRLDNCDPTELVLGAIRSKMKDTGTNWWISVSRYKVGIK